MGAVTVPKIIEQVTFIFKLNNEMVTRTLAGLTDADCWTAPVGGGNPIMWLVGHATISRAGLLNKLGAGYDHGLGPLFNRGAVRGDLSAYPSRQVIEAAWNGTRARMRDGFASLTEEMLVAPPSGHPLPGVSDNAGLIAFMAFHESYHVGQMGYLRRMLGHSGVAG
jgi:DinB superfamily